MVQNFFSRTNGLRQDAQAVAADELTVGLSEAENALKELANVFLQQQTFTTNTNRRFDQSSESGPGFGNPLP